MERQIFIILLLSILGFALCSPTSLNRNLEIVGGDIADIIDFPYQVSFRTYGYHRCGGSLIAPSFVLTAAHCIVGKSLPIDIMSVAAGMTDRLYEEQSAKVAEVHLHPEYNSSKDLDVAILELDKPFSLSVTVQTIALSPPNDEPLQGTMCVATGWGYLSQDQTFYARLLRKVSLPIIDRKECRNYYEKVTDNEVCAGYLEGGKDTCIGDSGGPLVYDKKQVGIVAWGGGCAKKNKPGVYVHVAKIRDFIKKIAGV